MYHLVTNANKLKKRHFCGKIYVHGATIECVSHLDGQCRCHISRGQILFYLVCCTHSFGVSREEFLHFQSRSHADTSFLSVCIAIMVVSDHSKWMIMLSKFELSKYRENEWSQASIGIELTICVICIDIRDRKNQWDIHSIHSISYKEKRTSPWS